jgi:hypothetical protein
MQGPYVAFILACDEFLAFFDGCGASLSTALVCTALDCRCAFSMARLGVSGMSVVVWVFTVAQVVIPWVVIAHHRC